MIGPDGKRTPAPGSGHPAVLSPQNAAALRTMMEAVTTVDGATGAAAAIAGYRVAGKTGTGKRLVDGKQQPGEVASFIGMAPADKPRYVIAVFAHTPGRRRRRHRRAGVPRHDGVHAASLPGAAVARRVAAQVRCLSALTGAGGTSSVSADEPPGRLWGRSRTTG